MRSRVVLNSFLINTSHTELPFNLEPPIPNLENLFVILEGIGCQFNALKDILEDKAAFTA
ncbi:MAG: hypothetical protein JNL65_13810 [Saprospiraceae bacterium]|nr:hypothetical protein [Saprospiraceae bacterium]HRG68024.1 hypothetical protein [Saprospiraceae bacterium]